MGGRASIVGAAVTHVGKVRDHNEDAHFFDAENGLFLVCDGMGGHAAGEVASAIAIKTIRQTWNNGATHGAIDGFLSVGTPDAKKQLLTVLRDGVTAAHEAIIAEAQRDESKTGMGTTLVGAIVVGGDVIFAHAGDSRAYLVRDNIAMQLTEDHTLLSRLLAAGIDVDLTGDGARFKSMLTNALGIGQECKVATFVVPLADGDRFLLCSDGISEYVKEAEVGEVLSKAASPSRAAQKLVDLALERGGGDNATALVVRVLEAGESPLPVERRKRDDDVIAACSIWGLRVNPQQRLRALRIAIPREYAVGEKVPAQTLGDRVAWIILEGSVDIDGIAWGPASLLYPEALVANGVLPDKDGLGVVTSDLRALAIRADDFREICDEDSDLGEALTEALVQVMAARRDARMGYAPSGERARAKTDPPVHDDPDAETTAILDGPPKKVSPISDATQPMPAVGRSDTMPLIAVPAGEEPAWARTSTREETPTGRARARSQNEEDAPTTVQEPVTKPDGGDALRALWGPTDAKLPLPAEPAPVVKKDSPRAHAKTDAPPITKPQLAADPPTQPRSQANDDAPTVTERPGTAKPAPGIAALLKAKQDVGARKSSAPESYAPTLRSIPVVKPPDLVDDEGTRPGLGDGLKPPGPVSLPPTPPPGTIAKISPKSVPATSITPPAGVPVVKPRAPTDPGGAARVDIPIPKITPPVGLPKVAPPIPSIKGPRTSGLGPQPAPKLESSPSIQVSSSEIEIVEDDDAKPADRSKRISEGWSDDDK